MQSNGSSSGSAQDASRTGGTFYQGAHGFHIEQQNNIVNHYTANPELSSLLNPILDASYTRNRKLSPPDSICLPGTREQVIKRIESWADSSVLFKTQHVMWIYGYVGCGKSSLAQTTAERYARIGRLAASFFFFRGSEDRSRTARLAATVASQLESAIPATRPHLKKALKSHPGILTTYSLESQFQHLVYEPMRKVSIKHALSGSFFRGPYLIIIDGLDECDDRDEIASFFEHMLRFFKENPRIPLRFLFTSRVEEHIRTRLDSDQVSLLNLIDHTSLADVAEVANATFALAARYDRVIKTYGEWPSGDDRKRLVEHSGGSLIFMSTLLKFIIGPNNDDLTPMERLPLALNISPGLDGLYSQTLARSETLPHFSEIITALILFVRPPSIVTLAEALGVQCFEVVRVLVNLHSILQVPGDDRTAVTVCHTSLRDFLMSESRAGRFFISQVAHNRVYARVFAGCEYGSPTSKVAAAVTLCRRSISPWEIWALFGIEHSQLYSALKKFSPVLNIPRLFGDRITLCDVSLHKFPVSRVAEGDMAYACFAVIAQPSSRQAAVAYAEAHAMDHWHSFVATLPKDAGMLGGHLSTAISNLRQIFTFAGIRIVNVILAILLTFSSKIFTISPPAFIDLLAQHAFLPGDSKHATLIAQVFDSFVRHSGLSSLSEIVPGILTGLSRKVVWWLTQPEFDSVVRAHIVLLLLEDRGQDTEPRFRCQEDELLVDGLKKRSQWSALFVSEFTLFVKAAKSRRENLLSNQNTIAWALTAEAPIDDLYIRILTHIGRTSPLIFKLLSTTALLYEALTLRSLSEFLDVETATLRTLLQSLRGIVDLPLFPTDATPVRLPPLFRAFLLDPDRSGEFFAHPSAFREIAVRCFQISASTPLNPTLRDLFIYVEKYCMAHWKASVSDLPKKSRNKIEAVDHCNRNDS